MLTGRLEDLEHEFGGIERDLSNPEVVGDTPRLLTLTRRHAELSPLVKLWREYQSLEAQRAEAQDLLADPEMRELAQQDLNATEARLATIEAELEVLLLPRDPDDHKNVILEIRSGAGGAEAGLFAADLLRLYQRYAEGEKLSLNVLDANESDLGGYAKLVAEVTGADAYRAFKFERGVHRVQRIPATESAGRIHTSTVTVAVLPEAEESEVQLDLSEVRIDVYRSQGAGGQGVNTTDSAVRAVYRQGTPDEIVVVCQETRSQIKNREKALTELRTRLAERERAAQAESEKQLRASQVGSGDRSEKIRTYNYPQNRVTDHRLSGEVKNFALEGVMEGELSPVTAALAQQEREVQLSEMTHGAA